jgi:hypothetical protein
MSQTHHLTEAHDERYVLNALARIPIMKEDSIGGRQIGKMVRTVHRLHPNPASWMTLMASHSNRLEEPARLWLRPL